MTAVGSSLGYALRATLLVLFVWFVWTVKYVPLRHTPLGDGDSEAAVRAINAGYPFQLMYEVPDGQPLVKKMSEVYGDYGLPMALAATAQIRHALSGAPYHADSTEARAILMAFFAATAAIFVAPAVPITSSIAGLAALSVLFEWGPLVIGGAQHWAVSYVAVVCAVLAATTLRPLTLGRGTAVVMLALAASWAQLLRQEAATVSYAAGLALVVSAAALIGIRAVGTRVRPWHVRDRLAVRALFGGLLLLVATATVQPLQRLWMARTWGTPFATTGVVAHGSGAPLYLSLGYVSNPYNIAWRDPVGQVHAALAAPGMVYSNPLFQPTLLQEYVRIVVERPSLFLRNVASKALRIHGLASMREAKLPDVAVWQTPVLMWLYRAVPWVVVGSLVVVIWRRSVEATLETFAIAAICAASMSGALIVFPDYIGGVQGAIVVLAVMLPLTVAGASAGADTTALSLWKWFGVAAMAGLLVVISFTAAQSWRNRRIQAAVEAADPVDGIKAMQFRYGHLFNDLPVARQGRLLARIQASHDPIVARVVTDRRGDDSLFRPEAVLRTASQIHVIVWLGSAFRPPAPPLYQGRTHSLVFVCPECRPELSVNDRPFDSGWTFVSDLEWRDCFRMFSFPLTPALKKAAFFEVDAERIVALDPTVQSTGLRSASIAGARFDFE